MAAPGVPQSRRVSDPSLADAINLSRLAAGQRSRYPAIDLLELMGFLKGAALGVSGVPVSAVRNLLQCEFLTAIITADDQPRRGRAWCGVRLRPQHPDQFRLLNGSRFLNGRGGTVMQFTMMIALGVVAVIALGFALAWVAPVVGITNSACERYPYTSGCR